MPYGYIVSVIVVAIGTLAALRPPRRPRWLAMSGYFAGMVVNEIPLVVLGLFMVSTVPAIATDGLLDTGGGQVVFAAAVAVTVGLVFLQLRIIRARPVIKENVGQPEGLSWSWWTWLFPWPIRPASVGRIRNINYGPDTGRRHRLDLYRRRDLKGPAPVLIYLHGGGYFSGSKHREGRALWYRMAKRGWVVVSAEYGLRPAVRFPEHLVDAKRVVAWVHDAATEYDMDPNTIVMAGSSAGAHLTALTALSPHEKAFQPGFEQVDTRIAAAICLYGYYGRYYGRGPDERPASTPLAYPAHESPPTLIVHGDLDNNTPVEDARALEAHLSETSPCTVAYAELPGAQHGFDVLASPRFHAILDGIESFLSQEISGSLRVRSG